MFWNMRKGYFFNLLGIKYVINVYHTGIVDLSLHATGLLVIYGLSVC